MKRIQIVSIQLVKEKNSLYEINIINSPMEVQSIANKYLEDVDREHFCILCLNVKNKINAIHTVAIGTLNSCAVHPREVFKPAILSNSSSVILFHNHPSGDPSPSREDIEVTKRLKEAGEIIGIEVFDHVVIGNEKYISLKEMDVL